MTASGQTPADETTALIARKNLEKNGCAEGLDQAGPDDACSLLAAPSLQIQLGPCYNALLQFSTEHGQMLGASR